MGRLNPQRRAALKALRQRQYAERLVLDLKNSHNVKSHALAAVGLTLDQTPVGHPKANARGWEFGKAPSGSVKAAGHLREGMSIPKPGTRLVMPSKGHKMFSRV